MYQSTFVNSMSLGNAEGAAQPYPGHVIPPPRALNGGLFTGEPFLEGAPWANVPVIPDVDFMTNVNLRSANPPTEALFQYPGNTRPGNNFNQNTGLQGYKGRHGFTQPHNFSCIPCNEVKMTQKECVCKLASNISGNSVNGCDCDKYTFVDV
jgi:hypothetical protein